MTQKPETKPFSSHFSTNPLRVLLAVAFWNCIVAGLPLFAQTATAFGPQPGDIRVTGDFDGDGTLDEVLWRPSTGTWYVDPSSTPTTPTSLQWGLSGDVPVSGDFEGDGLSDYAVWRPSTGYWYILPTIGGTPITQQWGLPGDIPVPGDYDGDGITDIAVWRPSTGTWYVIPSSSPTAPIAYQFGLPGDIPVPGDYNADNQQDYAVYRPSNAVWYVTYSGTSTGVPTLPSVSRQWGLPGDIPAGGFDFDGDFIADYAVWRPSSQLLYIIPSTNPTVPYASQISSPASLMSAGNLFIGNIQGAVWVRVAGDFDGDGIEDFALWSLTDGTSGLPNTGMWNIIPSSNPSVPVTQSWGLAGDVPVPGDIDGDGKTDLVVWRPSEGKWYVDPISNLGSPLPPELWGIPGDIPVHGDFDSDGKADYAVWRPSNGTWNILPSSNLTAPITEPWGLSGDIPVTSDYDGDGKTDYAVWRPANGVWYVLPSSNLNAPITQPWGLPGDLPVRGDFTGSGKASYNIWRPWTATAWISLDGTPNTASMQESAVPGNPLFFKLAPRTR